MLLNNRHGSVDSDAYRYDFQGQERDDEVKGIGNSYNYKYRMHDPRLGRFFAVDPLAAKYPWYTPYQFSGNTPIMSSELEGLEPKVKNSVLVGYTIQSGQGPTQIAKDINNKQTQKEFGYTIQKSINWKTIVIDNLSYYMSRGDWENPNMLDVDNPAWSRMNSNKGELLTIFNLEESVVATTTKPLFGKYLDPVNDATNLISLGLTTGTFLADIDKYGDALKSGNFIANYGGQTRTWSMKFYGNGSVSSSFVKDAKLNTKVLGGLSNAFKIGGVALTLFSSASTEYMYQNGEISNAPRVKSHLDNGTMLLFPPAAIGIIPGNYLGEKYAPEITEEITNPNSTTTQIMSFLLNLGGIPASEEQHNEMKEENKDG